MKRKNKKSNVNRYIIIIVIIIIIVFSIYSFKDYNVIKSEISNESVSKFSYDDFSYVNSKGTVKSLDEFYDNIDKGIDSTFEEYTVSKNVNDFSELKMTYENQVKSIYRIESNLKKLDVRYEYELFYEDSHIFLEGSSDDNYECNVVVQDFVDNDSINYCCEIVKEEINNFLSIRSSVLNNSKYRR